MKKLILMLNLIVFLGLISGCEPHCIVIEPERQVCYSSDLFVNFVDSAGNSLASELALIYTPQTDPQKMQFIDRNDYFMFFHFLSNCRGYPTNNLEFANRNLNDFTLRFHTDQPEEAPEYVRYDLQCPKMFGDDKFHVIESSYSTKSAESDLVIYCSSFTFDGEEFEVDSLGRVTVIIDVAKN
ncbi:MAG: hypothetical protein K2K52_05245 [Paramuribaculum sp.]|nr:hypothetical protein [Paramuribaculum sp.]